MSQNINTANLNISGNPNARIVVVTDAPQAEAYELGNVMANNAGKKFRTYAERAGFDMSDFVFINPCPPLPETIGTSVRREDDYLAQYKEEFDTALQSFANAELIIVLGATAGAQVVPRFKIMQSRGQIKGTKEVQLGQVIPVFAMLKPEMILKRPESEIDFESDFRQLALLQEHGFSAQALADSMTSVEYEWVTDLSPLLRNPPKAICLDTETKGGLAWFRSARAICVQLSWEEGKSWVLPLDIEYFNDPALRGESSRHLPMLTERDRERLVNQLRELLSNPRVAVIGHNLKFDLHILKSEGIEVANWHADTMQLAFAADDNMQSKTLDECVRRWVPAMAGYADQFNIDPVHCGKEHMERVPHDDMLKYAGGDSDAALRLGKLLNKLVREDRRQFNCYSKVQMPALRTFFKMERHGVKIDACALRSFTRDLAEAEQLLYNELIVHVPASIRRRHVTKKNGLSFTRDDFLRDILFTREGFGLTPRMFTPSTARLKNPAERIPSVSIRQHLPFFSAFGVPWADDGVYFANLDDQNAMRASEKVPQPPLDAAETQAFWEKGFPFITKLIEYRKIQKMRSTYVGHEASSEFTPVRLVGKQQDKLPKPVIDTLAALGIDSDAARASAEETRVPYKKGCTLIVSRERVGIETPIDPSGYWRHMDELFFIHPSFMLHRVVTGRTSSAAPNGQNIPKRGKLAKPYRKIFKPSRPGWKLAELDLSQIELRIAAVMANETNMIRIYEEGGDIHEATAAAVMGVSIEAFRQLDAETREHKRFQAKAVNFGFLYGMGWRKFMSYAKTDYGIEYTEQEAQDIRIAFFARYPRLKNWHVNMRDFVQRHDYVRALHGALRRLPAVRSVEEGVQGEAMRQAINSPVQRMASDLGLIGLAVFAQHCNWDFVHPLMFVHDAVVIEGHPDYIERACAELKYCMENPPLWEWFQLRLPLPLISDVKIGDDLKSVEDAKHIQAIRPDWFTFAALA